MEHTSPLPEGTITFLFTDVEGSTRLWEQHPEAMQQALARHDALLRRVIAARGGHLFKTWGDQFCAAFSAAPDALAVALEAQQSLRAEPWEDLGVLGVRMALHTGPAQERDGDYFGPSLSRVARQLAAGHGGQILLSQATEAAVRDQLPAGASLQDLGEHRLRDLARPERIYQLQHPDLPAGFPPLRALEAFSHNLPVQLTSFIGREPEMAEVKRLLLPRNEERGMRNEKHVPSGPHPSSLIPHAWSPSRARGAAGKPGLPCRRRPIWSRSTRTACGWSSWRH